MEHFLGKSAQKRFFRKSVAKIGEKTAKNRK
jgi:hypothetical protein